MTTDPRDISSSSEPQADQLVDPILSDISEKYGLDLWGDPTAMARIREAAAKAFQDLQAGREAIIDLPFISANASGPIHYRRVINQAGGDQEGIPGQENLYSERQPAQEMTRVELPDRKPLVTIGLLVIMVVLYLLQELTGYLFSQDIPAALGMKINQAIQEGQYWRLITPMFLHGSLLHLGFNLYALYILGRRTERFFGHWRFLGLFLLGGISGNLFSFIFTASPSLGSSTAIFGLLAAEGVFIYQHQNLFGDRFRSALRQIIQVAVVNFLIGLSPGIDNWGHFGGLLGGMAFAWFAGPVFELRGSPPVVGLRDKRPEKESAGVFLIQLLILVGISALVIISRG